jgi:hypothetical protein
LGFDRLNNSNYINGHLKKFSYYSSPLSEDNLRALTGNKTSTSRYSSANIVTNGLILYLDAGNPASYPGSGTTWTDLSGNGNNGTLLNGVGYNSNNGGSLTFDGVNDYVNFGNSSVFNQSGGKSFTITCWARVSSASNPFNAFLSKSLFSGEFEYALGLGPPPNNGVWWLTSSNGTNWVVRGAGENISLSVWYYYAVGYDFANQVSFASINGKSIFTSTQTGIYNGSRPFEIGRHNDPVTYSTSRISNLQFYNRVLTASEIQQNFNATRGRFGI